MAVGSTQHNAHLDFLVFCEQLFLELLGFLLKFLIGPVLFKQCQLSLPSTQKADTAKGRVSPLVLGIIRQQSVEVLDGLGGLF